jgi:hypothetical protein
MIDEQAIMERLYADAHEDWRKGHLIADAIEAASDNELRTLVRALDQGDDAIVGTTLRDLRDRVVRDYVERFADTEIERARDEQRTPYSRQSEVRWRGI